MKNLLFVLLIFTSFISCDKDEKLGEFDAFLFGSFYGECFDTDICIEIFKIEEGKLYEDKNDEYPTTRGNEYDWTLKSDSLYQLVKDLPSMVPDSLLLSTEMVFGGPDTYDQGGVFVGINDGDAFDIWLIDTTSPAIPDFLVDFKDRILTAVDDLR